MTITAYVHGSTDPNHLGNLKDGGTLTVEGVTYEIPDRAQRGGRFAPRRIIEALEAAGYKPATNYYGDLSKPNADGVYEIQVVKA
ncbi:hypothetical protein Ade02nite_20550 [Paractinoplanes deccanensis]|uniref:Uncharacterized protein n=1 Tax=Paractinoplanes deccanensis TaxID=113561 RepID=A0ABQ3Y086_9ACTN|nr:hypothetical protein [Actinoplanes deccanensis]GID73414.1 hypothetical protein Ade02nite_20550 [Actinoplanes deccanensis]